VGERLPFATNSFDAVLCLETIEHVHGPAQLGAEIMRILKPGGVCMLTTPPRLRYLVKGDPHYGVRGLLLLPDALQPIVARRAAGVTLYDVVHIFWTTRGILQHFPGARAFNVMWNQPKPFRSKAQNALWWAFRYWLWDRIVFRK
jgi:SAM-dependent methyltransferase